MLHVFERREARPMHDIFMPSCTPALSQETVTTTDDLGIEISSQLRPIVGQTADPKITT